VAALLAAWVLSTRRKLAVLEENVNNAMNQIGVQLSCRFEALSALLEIAKGCAGEECQALVEAVNSSRSAITGRSAPADVLRQEAVFAHTLGRLTLIVAQHPDIKDGQAYQKTMGAVETFESMMRTSCLIYNDSVMRLNRAVRLFPTALIAAAMGFRQRDYLGDRREEKTPLWAKLTGHKARRRVRQRARKAVRGKGSDKMGLFSKKPPCAICGGKVPRILAAKIEGEYICNTCFGKIDMESGRANNLTMQAFRQYLTFYEENRKLREKFIVSERIDFGAFDTKIIFDFENKLFCMSKNPDKTVFEGWRLKSFVIKEDSTPLFEGVAEGIRRYPSTVPERVMALSGEMAQYAASRRMAKALDRMDDGVENGSVPRYDVDFPEPFSKFNVEIYVEHPYWSHITCDMDGPRFDREYPDASDYLSAYRERLEVIVRLVQGFKEVAFPDASERLAGFGAIHQGQKRAAPASAVEEIRKYKALLDDGIITEDEFREKKRQLMGL
jgi:hypothetical protein